MEKKKMNDEETKEAIEKAGYQWKDGVLLNREGKPLRGTKQVVYSLWLGGKSVNITDSKMRRLFDGQGN